VRTGRSGPITKKPLLPTAISRRHFLGAALGGSLVTFTEEVSMAQSIATKAIPKTGEMLPVVGLGTWQTFDIGETAAARNPLRAVMGEFARAGGRVIDSSPMYGSSEHVVGDIAHDLGIHKELFLATKVWTSGREAGVRQMEQSFRRLRTQRMDLMQVHNLVDYRIHLETLRRWKEQGKVRYIGVTHYTKSAYDDLARVLASEELDFVQLNYSLGEREAEKRLLPLAAQKQMAVLVNRPFAEGALFRRTKGKPLPAWAREYRCENWAQFFLKFIVSHPAVTCAIPATSKLDHLNDNMRAGFPPVPDPAARDRMARYFAEL
jgi:diketogulonate reductase-like aldo/keto reductase